MGSEMCIRDRQYAARHRGDQGEAIVLRSGVGGTHFDDWTRITFCLLYTSDAADERSSVDLGGRRIIKKKKEHYRGERR